MASSLNVYQPHQAAETNYPAVINKLTPPACAAQHVYYCGNRNAYMGSPLGREALGKTEEGPQILGKENRGRSSPYWGTSSTSWGSPSSSSSWSCGLRSREEAAGRG